jgi:hypothetical protein
MLEFIQLKKEHLDLQIALTRKAFGRDPSEKFYQWKYFDNPAGEVVGYAAYDTEKKKNLQHTMVLYPSCMKSMVKEK